MTHAARAGGLGRGLASRRGGGAAAPGLRRRCSSPESGGLAAKYASERHASRGRRPAGTATGRASAGASERFASSGSKTLINCPFEWETGFSAGKPFAGVHPTPSSPLLRSVRGSNVGRASSHATTRSTTTPGGDDVYPPVELIDSGLGNRTGLGPLRQRRRRFRVGRPGRARATRAGANRRRGTGRTTGFRRSHTGRSCVRRPHARRPVAPRAWCARDAPPSTSSHDERAASGARSRGSSHDGRARPRPPGRRPSGATFL